MSTYLGSPKLNVVSALAAGAISLIAGLGLAQAQSNPTSDQILHSLTPKALTRGLSVLPEDAAKAATERRTLEAIRDHERTRSLSIGEREQVAAIAKDKPKIDLEINFDFNSDKISETAIPTIAALAKALNDPTLKGRTVMVAGYTDAKGTEDYNQGLSERRAEAVKQMLVEKYGIAADNLLTVGYGKTHLKTPEQPFAAKNRRVGIVNMASSVAGK